MTTIYTGCFDPGNGIFDKDWVGRALARQKRYCDHWGFDYEVLKEIPWGMNYPLRHSWGFATTIKFVALHKFLDSDQPHFNWFDMDVYPTDKSFDYNLPQCNLLSAWIVPWEFADGLGHDHMRAKREWGGFKEDYFAVNTGMFCLDREAATSLWDYINAEHDIRDNKWWELFHARQLSFSDEEPFLYGSEEAIIEAWANEMISKGFEFMPLTDNIHSVKPEHDPIFLHYYGSNKSRYPGE
jgi:hypothetical protein